MQIIRIPGWHWPSYGRAEYYGRRHGLTIGPMLILWGQMTASEIDAYETREARE